MIIAEHNSDGSCSIMVKEDETERMEPMEEIELDLDQEELELDY